MSVVNASPQSLSLTALSTKGQTAGALKQDLSFKEVMSQFLTETVHKSHMLEQANIKQSIDGIDYEQMVGQIKEMDLDITALVAIRDRLVGLIQELQKMPI
jgi:flagellar hook-basal body complex protein FliE